MYPSLRLGFDLSCTGLFLERAREPVALYFAVGLSLFAGSEPGGLSLIWWDMLDSSGSDHIREFSKEHTIPLRKRVTQK